jgi:tetratricopeptide (TPR) repeat protein
MSILLQSSIFNSLGEFHHVRGTYDTDVKRPDYDIAREYYEKSLGLLCPGVKPTDVVVSGCDAETATVLNNLAKLYDDMGNYGDAELLYQKVAEIRKATWNNDMSQLIVASHLVTTLNNLALLYHYRWQDYQKAANNYDKAMEVCRSRSGLELEASQLRVNVTQLAFDQGQIRSSDVEIAHVHAVSVCRKAIKQGVPQATYLLVVTLNNWARFYSRLRKFDSAGQLYKEILNIHEERQWKKHLSYASSLANYAKLLQHRDRFQAYEKFKEASKIYEEIRVKDSSTGSYKNRSYYFVADFFRDFADFYWDGGNHPKAGELYQKALDIYQQQNLCRGHENDVEHSFERFFQALEGQKVKLDDEEQKKFEPIRKYIQKLPVTDKQEEN